MKRRRFRKVYRRWLIIPQGKLPWKKKALERVLEYQIHERFLPDNISQQAW